MELRPPGHGKWQGRSKHYDVSKNDSERFRWPLSEQQSGVAELEEDIHCQHGHLEGKG